MTSNDRGTLLGSYAGSWRWGALTALFPLLWALFVLPGALSTGRWATLAWVLLAALVWWLLVGAWVVFRAGTRLEIFERSVVWTRPLLGERAFAPRDVQRITNLARGGSPHAVRVELLGGREHELVGFAELAEISNLIDGARRAATTSLV